MKRSGTGYVLSTGREIYAHRGIIGINDRIEVFDGYDGQFDDVFDLDEERDYGQHLTPAERAEICDYMIELWQQRKAKG